ncbi:MAG: HAD family hydrolase [Clostridia bacterium]|nr:HAD family hydrolase [Clostridia bacterium]
MKTLFLLELSYLGYHLLAISLSQKYRLFIVSNCQAGYIEVFLKSSGFGQYFEGHLCPGDTGNAKADNIRQIIRDYKLASPVYVGDTDGDHRATKSAGIPFVFAAYGFGSVCSPDYTINCPKELLKIF